MLCAHRWKPVGLLNRAPRLVPAELGMQHSADSVIATHDELFVTAASENLGVDFSRLHVPRVKPKSQAVHQHLVLRSKPWP